MNKEFTLKEYIAEHSLGVADRDVYSMKIVAKHLLSLGYKRERRRHVVEGQPGPTKAEFVYTKNDRQKDLEILQAKLEDLAKKEQTGR
jgi:hypothetical protein